MSLLSGCTKAQLDEFQFNDKSAPFNIFHLFDGYAALTAAWNSVPGITGNQKMAQMMIDDIPGTAEFLYILSFLMDRSGSPGLGLLDHIKATLALATNSSERFYGNNRVGPTYNINSFYGDNSAPTYLNDFYGFLDEISRNTGGSSPKVGSSVVSIISKIMPYLQTKSDADLARFMEELYMPTFYTETDYGGTVVRVREGNYSTAAAAGLSDNSISSLKVPFGFKVTLYPEVDFGGIPWTFDSNSINIDTASDQASSLKVEKNPTAMKDLAELLAQPVAMADFPMWIDTKGTADAGDDELVTNYADMNTHGNIADSNLGNMASGMQSLISGLITLMNGKTTDRAFLYDLFGNLNDALNNKEMIKRTIWNLSNYFTTNGSIYGTKNISTVDPDFVTGVYNTDFTNTLYSNAELKETLQEFLTLAGGLFQRDDRRSSMTYKTLGTTSQEYPFTKVPQLIDNLYINWDQTQLKESIYDMIRYDALGRDRRSGPPAYAASMLEHLLFLGGITGNFGFKHLADGRELGSGSIDPLCATSDCVGNRHGHGEHVGYLTLNDSLFSCQANGLDIYATLFAGGGAALGSKYRSKHSFAEADRDDYVFEYSWDYPALHFLSGACAGDQGVPNGGNDGGGDGAVTDAYKPFAANGIGTKDLASWTFSLIARVCIEGEGPYYYKDPAATTATIGAFTGRKYLRPDGRIYALVNDAGDYFYPVDGGNDAVDSTSSPSGQRWNRFKSSWETDYYLLRDALGNNYNPSDMSGGATGATASGSLTYDEITLSNSQRQCASHEEAIFRNYQWVLNEKKMVLVIPLVVLGAVPVFQIVEGNGVTGLSMARKYRDNNVWAKAGTDGSSTIPGDYRVTVLPLGVTGDFVYSTIDRGTLTPAAIGQNIVVLSRLAFPRSPVFTGTYYRHKLLGSLRVNNDSENTDQGFSAWSSSDQGDQVWKKRNSLVPLLIALIENLHIKSYYTNDTNYNNAVAKMLSGLQPLVKPLIFFNYDISNLMNILDNPTRKRDGVAKNCWLPRVKGTDVQYRYHHSRYLMPDVDVSGFDYSTSSLDGWYGGDNARNFYAPKEIPTILSVLLDSDTSTTRLEKTQRADGLLAVLTKYTAGTSGRPDETVTMATHTEPGTAAINDILYGLEQLTSSMKMAEATAITIYRKQSKATAPVTFITKQLNPPLWIFNKRQRPNEPTKYIDIDAEKMLNKLLGGDNGLDITKGLNQFHDDLDTFLYNDGKPDWTNLTNANDDGALDNLYTVTSKFLIQGAQYPISINLFNIIDALYLHNPTPAEIKGALYNIGKLFAYYDGSHLPTPVWLLQGDTGFKTLYDFLMAAVPILDNEMALYSSTKVQAKGATYRSLLSSLEHASADNGLMQFIVDSASLGPYSSGDLLNDLPLWLDSNLISGADTVFYSTMSEMLQLMADIAFYAPSEEGLYSIYDQYGFQRNEMR